MVVKSDQIIKNVHLIRVERGERVSEEIERYCELTGIQGGFLHGLGAVDQVELAHYDVSTQKYSSQTFEEPLEVASLDGSIGIGENGILIVHLHGTFSDPEMKTYAGHIVEMRVSGTLEIILHETDKLSKKHDDDTGLEVFDFSSSTQ